MMHKPDGYTTVSPYLIVDGAARTIDFLTSALGAKEIRRFTDDKGGIRHAEVRIGRAGDARRFRLGAVAEEPVEPAASATRLCARADRLATGDEQLLAYIAPVRMTVVAQHEAGVRVYRAHDDIGRPLP